jgi:hypothetical protein
MYIGLRYIGPAIVINSQLRNAPQSRAFLFLWQYPPENFPTFNINPFMDIVFGHVRQIEKLSANDGKMAVNAFGDFDNFLRVLFGKERIRLCSVIKTAFCFRW